MEQTGYPANIGGDTAYQLPTTPSAPETLDGNTVKARYPDRVWYQLTVPLEGTAARHYYFARPNMLQINRFTGLRAGDIGQTACNLLCDCVVKEQRDQLMADLQEYPALPISLAEPLLQTAGLTQSVNLQRL